MHIYTTRLTLTAALASPPRCLACGEALEAVGVDDRVNFWCVVCALTWKPELGGMVATPGEAHPPRVPGVRRPEGPPGPHP